MIKTTLAAAAMGLLLAVPVASKAQTQANPGQPAMAQAADMSDGEVRKVDLARGKVTIKHGDIKHLDMPAMTMVFTAKDKDLLNAVKPGDKVKFMVVDEGGKMVLTAIEPVK